MKEIYEPHVGEFPQILRAEFGIVCVIDSQYRSAALDDRSLAR